MSTPAARTGRDAAQLVRDHQAGVWRYLRVLGCDASTADDLTQETFLAVLTRPFEDRGQASSSRYLRTVARNLFLTEQRRRARHVLVEELAEIEAVWERWAGDDEGEQLLTVLQGCLQRLSERAQLAIRLRYSQDLSREELASQLEMSEDGAKNVLQRSKTTLKECIERGLRSA